MSRRNVSFFSRARDGFASFIATAGQRYPRVLLPSYVGWSSREGSGVLDPVLASGLPFDFYPINAQFEPDIDCLKQLAEQGPPALVVLIHYFGRRSPCTRLIKDIVSVAGGIMFEDWAHGLFSHRAAAPIGDAAIYSVHKMLPIPTGGALVSANYVESARDELASEILRYDLDEIATRRRRNFNALVANLSGAQLPKSLLSLPWARLTETDVPQSLPLFVPAEQKHYLYRRLNALGIGVTSLYHTMATQIDGERFPLSHYMSSRILNLPVHQDIEPATCVAIATTFLDILNEGQR